MAGGRVIRRAVALIFAGSALVGGLVALAPSASARAAAGISLSPGSGAPGSSVTVSWHGFNLCGGAVAISWDGSRLATGSVLPFGQVSATVPKSANGSHIVTAGCPGQAYSASAIFYVTGSAPTTPARPDDAHPHAHGQAAAPADGPPAGARGRHAPVRPREHQPRRPADRLRRRLPPRRQDPVDVGQPAGRPRHRPPD